MCAVLVLPPLDPRADVGIVILEQGGFRPMSGSNTMCAITALLETGSLPATEPETVVRIDTAVGPVEATARVEAGRVRSPCGTGTCARMAALHARGELGLGVPFIHQGVLGTTFRGLLHEATSVGGREAVVPSIQGRAWITGHTQHVLQPDDPFATGLTVGDIWSSVRD
jgi:proline racemase